MDKVVSFVQVGECGYAKHMVASVRDAMPDYRIVQMSDRTTRKVDGAHELMRHAANAEELMVFRLQCLADFKHEAMLILDNDVIVKKSVDHVFDDPFDVALTKRDRLIMLAEGGWNAHKVMPYNTGVMFSRTQEFWKECSRRVRKLPDDFRKWWGDQLVVAAVAGVGGFKVKELHVQQYNWTPLTEDDSSDALIWHYKGERKHWIRNENPTNRLPA